MAWVLISWNFQAQLFPPEAKINKKNSAATLNEVA